MGNKASKENKPKGKGNKGVVTKKKVEKKSTVGSLDEDLLKRFETDFPEYSEKSTCIESGVVPKGRIEEAVRFSREFERKVRNGEKLKDLIEPKKKELLTLLTKVNPEIEDDLAYPILAVADLLNILSSYQTSLRFYSVGLKCITRKRLFSIYLGNIGLIWDNLGEYDRAMIFYQKSLEIKREIGDRREEATTLTSIGAILRKRADYSAALEYMEKSLKIDKEVGDKEGEGVTLFNIGVIHRNRNEYDLAMDCYQKSLSIAEEVGNKQVVGANLNSIGIIHGKRKEYSKAIECYEKTLKIFKELGDKSGEAGVLNNIASIHQSKNEISTAIEYYQKSVKIEEEIGNKHGEALTLWNIGFLLKDQKKYVESLNSLERSKKLYESMKLKHDVEEVSDYIKLVEIEIEKEKTTKLEFQIQGSKLSDYQLSERLGKNPQAVFGYDGCNSVVMECRFKRFEDVPLAMKILFNIVSGDESMQKKSRFIRENLLKSDIISEERLPKHENVMSHLHSFHDTVTRDVFKHKRHFELFQEDFICKKTGFIITRKFQGNIKQFLLNRNREPLSEMEILLMMRGALRGIVHLFKNLLVHRDLNLGNYLLTEKGNVVLADFGVHFDAKAESQTEDKTGAIFYLPPEAIRRIEKEGFSTKTIDPNYEKSDVFGAGILLYSLLTCGNENAWGELNERSDEKFVEIESEMYSKELKELVRRMLLIDFEKRVQCDKALEIVEGLIKKKELEMKGK